MPPEQRKAFLLRVPEDLWKEIEKWAADELRSANAQVEFLLRQAVAKRKGAQPGQRTGAPGAPPGPGGA